MEQPRASGAREIFTSSSSNSALFDRGFAVLVAIHDQIDRFSLSPPNRRACLCVAVRRDAAAEVGVDWRAALLVIIDGNRACAGDAEEESSNEASDGKHVV